MQTRRFDQKRSQDVDEELKYKFSEHRTTSSRCWAQTERRETLPAVGCPTRIEMCLGALWLNHSPAMNPQFHPSCLLLRNSKRRSNPSLRSFMENQNQNQLVVYRKRLRLSQKAVARLLGHISTAMISRYERGKSVPPLSTALRLEIIYRVPVAFLFPGLYDQLRNLIRGEEMDICGVIATEPSPISLY
jgi:DNA-binding transcriptional regulator YiaG